MAKYSVNNHSVENIISWINSGEIAIPEMQRPFVWEASKVRDLMDSLYKGYPVGYILYSKIKTIKIRFKNFRYIIDIFTVLFECWITNFKFFIKWIK